MTNRSRDRYLAAACFTLAVVVPVLLMVPGVFLLLFAALTYVIENWLGQILPSPPPAPNSSEWLNAARNAAERSRMIGDGLLLIALGFVASLPFWIVRRKLLRRSRHDPKEPREPAGAMLR